MDSLLQRAQAARSAAHALVAAATTTTATTHQAAVSSISCGSEGSNAWQARATLERAVVGAADEAESVVKLLSEGQDPSRVMCASLFVSGVDAIAAVMQRVSSLECKLHAMGVQLAQLQQQVDEQRADSDSLLFCELATQAVSKIIRTAIPGCSVWDACFTPLSAIKEDAVYCNVMQQYPLLKVAVKAACNQGRSIAHPVPVPPVTEHILRALIRRAVAAPVRPAAEQLLACLIALARDLEEPLFVTAAAPLS